MRWPSLSVFQSSDFGKETFPYSQMFLAFQRPYGVNKDLLVTARSAIEVFIHNKLYLYLVELWVKDQRLSSRQKRHKTPQALRNLFSLKRCSDQLIRSCIWNITPVNHIFTVHKEHLFPLDWCCIAIALFRIKFISSLCCLPFPRAVNGSCLSLKCTYKIK